MPRHRLAALAVVDEVKKLRNAHCTNRPGSTRGGIADLPLLVNSMIRPPFVSRTRSEPSAS